MQVLHAAPTVAKAFHDLEHPAGSLPAGRALAARFMGKKATDVVDHIDNAGRFIKNSHGGGAETQAAYFSWTIEIERNVKLLLGHDAHADAAGDSSLGLAALPNAAAIFIDQLANRGTQRQLDTARPVDVAADAVELWTVAAG